MSVSYKKLWHLLIDRDMKKGGNMRNVLTSMAVSTSYPSQFGDNSTAYIISFDQIRFYAFIAKHKEQSVFLAAGYADKWNGATSKWVNEVLRSKERLLNPKAHKQINQKNSKQANQNKQNKAQPTTVKNSVMPMFKPC
jgi:hypothetical protein